MKKKSSDNTPSLGFAKFLSWTLLGLILISSLVISGVTANFSRQVLLTKQQEFAVLLASNLNHQIYRRFILPTLLGYGYIALQEPDQFERLDQVVTSTIHGLHIQDLRIYDHDRTISYASNRDIIGQRDTGGVAVNKALDDGEQSFELISRMSALEAMFTFDSTPESFVLKIIYPLRTEQGLSPDEVVVGALEISQDITEDYQTVVNFQWLIIGTAFSISIGLFLVMLLIIRRAENMQAARLAEKNRLEKELNQSEKLASMGRTVAGIAHEIRNPLGIICSTAEMLMRRVPPTDTNARFMKAIHDEATRLSRTVNEFLDYARPKTPVQVPVNLSELLDQAITFLEIECAKKQIVIEKDYGPGITIPGDKDLLYRAFSNVMVNAMQALPEHGKIVVSIREGQKGVKVIFQDNGPGFDKNIIARLPEPFLTTKDNGTGLGLSIVNTIVIGHGGHFSLANAPEGGALVTMDFSKDAAGR